MTKSRFARSIVLLAALAGVGATAQDTSPQISKEQKASVLADLDKIVQNDAFVPGVDFSKWPALIQAKSTGLEAAKTKAEFTSTVNSALREFGFSHIVLFSPDAAQQRQNRKMVGLGVRIQVEDNGIRVTFVFPDGAAVGAGIQIGDLITAADGKPVRQPADLAGEEGSKVKVTIIRDGKEISFDVVRRAFRTDLPETLKWVDSKTAVLTVPSFDLGFNMERIKGLMIEANKAENLVIDLRSNGGGQVLNLIRLSGYFLKSEEPLGTFISRRNVKKFQDDGGDPSDLAAIAAWTQEKVKPIERTQLYEGKVAVLINGGTGSASEMFAAAMRDYRGARLIGTKSAGAVLASLMRPISEGFLLQYPITDYVTIKGTRIEGNGLVPDTEAATNRFGEEDKAVAEAVKWFSTAAKSGNSGG